MTSLKVLCKKQKCQETCCAGPLPQLTTPPQRPSLLTYLSICLVPKGIKDFLDSHYITSPPIHCLPHNAIGLVNTGNTWSAC